MKCTVRRINVNLTEKENEALKRTAKAMGEKESEIVRKAIMSFTSNGKDLQGNNGQ
jgi:hypothetical protein